ncbi:MAG: FAD-dependent thymidylate synthase [Candidatus Methanomethylophilaceae archaeon]|nr:FAD-dependent thymidylate synthase [Candidatus Methanomethylophilaceae archaeon]
MKVELIACTNVLDGDGLGLGGADHVCNMAAKNCVSEEMPRTHYFEDTYFFWEDEDLKSLKHALFSGHESVIEHAVFCFAISGISRACSHQLVRHRLASYSQQSQRYVKMLGKVNESQFDFVTPESLMTTVIDDYWNTESGDNSTLASEEFESLMESIGELYERMIDAGIPEEDARYVLPNACCTNIVVTMNGRQLRKFFMLRCCNRAQWEIREMANLMLAEVKKVAPVIFEDAGASCDVLGYCPEQRSCGKCQKLKTLLDKDTTT